MPKRAKNAGDRDTRGVEAVDRALRLLQVFADHSPWLTLGELAEHTGYYKSTILRILASLEDASFIARSDDKRYRLGPQLMRLGAVYQKSLNLDSVVRPILRELMETTGESASLFRRDGNFRICLFREESAHSVRDHVREGDLLPIDRGAAGHVLRAFDGLTLGGEAMRSALASLPKASFGERDAAAAGLAVPVFSTGEGLIGALAVSGSITRFTEDRLPEMGAALCSAGRRLSHALGGQDYWP